MRSNPKEYHLSVSKKLLQNTNKRLITMRIKGLIRDKILLMKMFHQIEIWLSEKYKAN